MRCANPVTYWAYVDSTGSTRVLVDGIQLTSATECTASQLVVMTQQEFDYATVSPFRLDMLAAGQISVAIMGLWAVGFAVRALIRLVRESDTETAEM